MLSADTRGTVNETGKPGHEISGNRTRVKTFVPMLSNLSWERIDLTIDSGCAACALPVCVASAVGMQELSRTPQECIAANAEKIRELRFKTPTLKIQNGDVHNLKFSVMDGLHEPLLAACGVVAADNRIVMHPENQGCSFIEDVRSKRRKRIFERNGVYLLPCCWRP